MNVPKFVVLAAAVALSGCSSWGWFGSGGERPRYPRDATVYKCNGGKELVVRYVEGGKSAMIVYPEREFRLDKVPSVAADARYTNGRTTLGGSGQNVTLEENGQALFTECAVAAG